MNLKKKSSRRNERCNDHCFEKDQQNLTGSDQDLHFCKFCQLASLRKENGIVDFFRSSNFNCLSTHHQDHFSALSDLMDRQEQNHPLLTNIIDLESRNYMLTLMKDIIDHFKFSEVTYMKAIKIFDYVSSTNNFPHVDHHFIMEVSVMVASKVSENANNHLLVSQLVSYRLASSKSITAHWNIRLANYYVDLELSILNTMNWQPNTIIPNDYLNLFLQKGVLTTKDFIQDFSSESLQIYSDSLTRLVFQMASQLSLQYSLYNFQSFSIATSIIVCARRKLKLSDWSYELYCLSGFNLNQIEDIANFIEVILNSCPHYQSIYDDSVKEFIQKIIEVQMKEDAGNHRHQQQRPVESKTSPLKMSSPAETDDVKNPFFLNIISNQDQPNEQVSSLLFSFKARFPFLSSQIQNEVNENFNIQELNLRTERFDNAPNSQNEKNNQLNQSLVTPNKQIPLDSGCTVQTKPEEFKNEPLTEVPQSLVLRNSAKQSKTIKARKKQNFFETLEEKQVSVQKEIKPERKNRITKKK